MPMCSTEGSASAWPQSNKRITRIAAFELKVNEKKNSHKCSPTNINLWCFEQILTKLAKDIEQSS